MKIFERESRKLVKQRQIDGETGRMSTKAPVSTSSLMSPKPFRFLDLPPELKDIIYAHVLVDPGGIEFCYEPSERHLASRQHGMEQLNQEDYLPSINRMPSRLRLLHVSRKFYDDAKPIFYGMNHFKFTNATGWFALDVFLGSLTQDDRSLLRHITVRHPGFNLCSFPMSDFVLGMLRLDHHDTPYRLEDGTIDQHRCFHVYCNPSWGQQPTRVVSALKAIPGLKSLCYVVPCEPSRWGVWSATVDYSKVDRRTFGNLPISVAALHCSAGLCTIESSEVAATIVKSHNNRMKGNSEPKWKLSEVQVPIPSPPTSPATPILASTGVPSRKERLLRWLLCA